MATHTKRIASNNSRLPTEPGIYAWSEYDNQLFEVRMFGQWLHVQPPKSSPLKITRFIAGKFTKVEPHGGSFVYSCNDLKAKK